MHKIILVLILVLINSSQVLAQENRTPVYKIQIEKSEHVQQEETETLDEIQFLPVERQKYKFKNITTPFDKFNYRNTSFDTENIDGVFKFNLSDEYNQHIEYAQLNLSKEITPNIKFNSNLYARNLFSNYSETQFDSETYFSTDFLPNHSIYFGQARLSNSNGRNVSFIQMAEDLYGGEDMGLKLDGHYKKFDYSIGAYDGIESDSDGRKSLGGTAAIKDLFAEKSKGSFSLGGGIYSTNENDFQSDTYGVFSEYNIDRFTIKGEFARNEEMSALGSFSESQKNTWGLSNKFRLTEHLNFIAGHNQKVEQLWRKNDIGFEYNAPKVKYLNIENLKFEVNASYINDDMQKETSRRFGFFTKYSF